MRSNRLGFALLSASLALATAWRADAFDSESTYITMPDGVKIAVAVSFPTNFQATDLDRWPTLLLVDGYEGGAAPIDPADYNDSYVTLHASIRGTGCSGGAFDLFDQQTAYDGYDIIEDWIVQRPWSNQKVGIIGHSYPGLTGFAIAETNPPHLTAIAVSGLVDDLYRGISYIGGIPDPGFALLWPLALRFAQETYGNVPRYIGETTSPDPTCAENIATRPPRNLLDDPIVNGVAAREDGQWWRGHSLITYIAGITKPIWIAQQYQDEQTGPRGGVLLWQNIPPDVPKRIVLNNGVHATNAVKPTHDDRVAWLDCWIRDVCTGDINDPLKRVQVHFETTGIGNNPDLDSVNPPYVSSDFPLPETVWARYFFHADGSLSTAPQAQGEGGRSYVATPEGREAYLSGAGIGDTLGDEAEILVDEAYTTGYGPATSVSGPDEVSYSLAFSEPTALAGPVMVTLYASSTAPDTDFFVQLLDVDLEGKESYLQRGLLRASFRGVDDSRADRIQGSGPLAGQVYRPYHPFTNATLLTPGEVNEYQIEVFPLGHVFRDGHRLVVRIYSPPAADELYVYGSGQPPALNTILEDTDHPSNILLSFLPGLPPISPSAPACGAQTGVRCVKPLTP